MPSNKPRNLSWYKKKMLNDRKRQSRPSTALQMTEQQKKFHDIKQKIEDTMKSGSMFLHSNVSKQIQADFYMPLKKICRKFTKNEIGEKQASSKKQNPQPMENLIKFYLINQQKQNKKIKETKQYRQKLLKKQRTLRAKQIPTIQPFFQYQRDFKPFQQLCFQKIQKKYAKQTDRRKAYQRFRKFHPLFKIEQQGYQQGLKSYIKNGNFYYQNLNHLAGLNALDFMEESNPQKYRNLSLQLNRSSRTISSCKTKTNMTVSTTLTIDGQLSTSQIKNEGIIRRKLSHNQKNHIK